MGKSVKYSEYKWTSPVNPDYVDKLYFSFCHNLPNDLFSGCDIKNYNTTALLIRDGKCIPLTEDQRIQQYMYIQNLNRSGNEKIEITYSTMIP